MEEELLAAGKMKERMDQQIAHKINLAFNMANEVKRGIIKKNPGLQNYKPNTKVPGAGNAPTGQSLINEPAKDAMQKALLAVRTSAARACLSRR